MAVAAWAFVWLGVPQGPFDFNRLRRLAFVVAATCAFFLVDGVRIENRGSDSLDNGLMLGARGAQARESHLLTLQVVPGPERPAEAEFSLLLYESVLTAKGARKYLPLPPRTGQLGAEQKISLATGTYLAIVSSRGSARQAHSFEIHAPKQVTITLAPASPRRVKVLVEGGDERKPLAGATVLLSDPKDPEPPAQDEQTDAVKAEVAHLPHGGITDRLGEVVFDEIPSGPQLVRIYAPGYQPYRAVIEGDIVVRLKPATTLEILVTDAGIPQGDAEVVISGAHLWPPQSVFTSGQGRIRLTGLAEGNYSIFARKGERISELAENVAIQDEAGKKTLELNLGRGSFVQALVVSSGDDKPIAGAKVSVGSAGLGEFRLYGRTDDAGRIQLGPLLSSSGLLQARAIGFVARSVPFPQPPSGDSPSVGDEPKVASPAPSDVLVRLDKAASITGRVVDERGFPIASATVEAVGSGRDKMPYSVTYNSEAIRDAHFDWAEDWSLDASSVLIPAGELGVMLGPVPPIPLGDVVASSAGSLTTDGRGYFEITGVPPGEGIVLARHPDFLDGKSQLISLSPGGTHHVEIVLKEGRPLRGRVVDHEGFPVAGARIAATSRGYERRTFTLEDGNFELGAAPAQVSLHLNSPDNPLVVLLVHEVKKQERDQKILITLPPPRTEAKIIIKGPDASPLGLAQVTITSLNKLVPLRQTRFTHDDGSAIFEAAAQLSTRVEVEANGYVSRSMDLKLQAEQTLSLEESLHAQGKVTAVRGRHVAAGAQITFKSGSFTRTVVAGDLGEFELSDLPPGRGELSASHPDYGKSSKVVNIQKGIGGRAMELPTLDLVPSLKVEGTVKDESGRPIEGALISADRLPTFLTQLQVRQALGRSDEDGFFSVEIERASEVYLFGAVPGSAFGFSDAIHPADLDRVKDIALVIDHADPAVPYEPGTVLFSMDARDGQIYIYAVAQGSQAERAGLREEDRLLIIDDRRPDDLADARRLLSGPLGGQLSVVVRRAGRELTFLVHRESYTRAL